MTWRLERLEAWARANGESTAAEFRRLLAEIDPELEDDG
jgi:hypothetical protein